LILKELKGICAALCTPFFEDGEKVDETALRNHIDSMLEAGIHIILVCGGTGEFAYLRPDERKRITEIASKHIDGRAGFLVQTSAINTRDAIEYARHAEGEGADCVLILPPYFEGPDKEGVYYHYEKIAKAIHIPIMAYNIPVHSGIDITPDFFQRLGEIDNVKYIKDSTGDIIRIQELLATGATVFNGGDPIAFFSLLAGCPGCVWGAPNAMPKEAVTLYNYMTSGKIEEARELWARMFPANLFFWTHVYNASVKAATNLSGRKVGPCRKPVQPLTQKEMNELKRVLQLLGI
jgi:4-hydroxy-tetrahydrodipicolinate synthase